MENIKIDDLIQAVQINPLDGVQVVNGTVFEADRLDLGSHLIVLGVADARTAREVKLKLLEKYPDEHRVALVAAATGSTRVQWGRLSEIDRLARTQPALSLYAPPLDLDERTKSFATTQFYMDAIQAGDIWVQQQTHESLLPYLMEESEEVAEAIAKRDVANLVEELGDILLQVIYHAGHAEQEGYFSLEDILETLNRKLRRRHPHVFDGYPVETIEDIDAMWQAIKKKEKENDNETR